ncbi:MAG: diaminopimelate decarboxylase [Candidatus Altiarchaeales archaeon]|nr:diaminopimelate decarboxylase [Candidatus Altiarchaeales archaeon]
MDDELLKSLAKEYGTPLYVYDADLIKHKCRAFKESFKDFPVEVKPCYAVKANTNLNVLKIIEQEGFGADVVSQGELDAVLRSGFQPANVMYTSNSKTESDLRSAVEAKVNVTVGNTDEINVFKKVGGHRIAFRVNPNVDAKTHPKISTALAGSKFGLHFMEGIAEEAVKKALDSSLNVAGIHCHIGSNVGDMSGFVEAGEKMFEFAAKLKYDYNIQLDFIDLGGGLGVRYQNEKVASVNDFAQAYKPLVEAGVEKLGYKPVIWFEPGRYIVAEAGVLLCTVNSIKKTPAKNFINTDAGFNDLVRPAMYDAYHHIRLAGKDGESISYDVAGNLCESGDILGKDRMLPEAEKGDIVVVENGGAYGFSMSSNYNSIPKPAEILVDGGESRLIRRRQSLEQLYEDQVV